MSIDRQVGTDSKTELQSRRVLRFVEPRSVLEGAGVRLKRSIALPELDYVDPFLLFDHFGSDDPEDSIAGFPRRPHNCRYAGVSDTRGARQPGKSPERQRGF